MNSDDVINALGNSPGVLTAITSNTTYTYTATMNLELTLNMNTNAPGAAVQVNGVTLALAVTGQPDIYAAKVQLAKGQTVTVTTLSNGSVLISARSIQ